MIMIFTVDLTASHEATFVGPELRERPRPGLYYSINIYGDNFQALL